MKLNQGATKQIDLSPVLRVRHVTGRCANVMAVRPPAPGGILGVKVEWHDDGPGDSVWLDLLNFEVLDEV